MEQVKKGVNMLTKSKIKELEKEAEKRRKAKKDSSKPKPSGCKYCPTCEGC